MASEGAVPPGDQVPSLHSSLKKKSPGSFVKTMWQTRYFALYPDKGCINTFKSEKEFLNNHPPHVIIPTDRIIEAKEYHDKGLKKPCRFNIFLEGGRCFEMTANTGAEADLWIYELNECVKNRAKVKPLSLQESKTMYWKPEIGYKALTVLQGTPFADRVEARQLRAFASYFNTTHYPDGAIMFASGEGEGEEEVSQEGQEPAFHILETGVVEIKIAGKHLCDKVPGDFIPMFEPEEVVELNIEVILYPLSSDPITPGIAP